MLEEECDKPCMGDLHFNNKIVLQRKGPHHGLEDACIVELNEGVASIADGITLPAYKDGISHLQSHAVQNTARLFCETSVEVLRNMRGKHALEKAVRLSNDRILAYNLWLGRSRSGYLGAVGAVASLRGADLHIGSIGDCGVFIFSKNEPPRRITMDSVAAASRYLDQREFTDCLSRAAYAKRFLRNQPQRVFDAGMEVSYGVLNGEDEALRYWETSVEPVRCGDILVCCTDGAIDCIYSNQLRFVADSMRESRDGCDTSQSFCSWFNRNYKTDDDASLAIISISCGIL